ncbi:histamine N-methyltransferase-like isoform X2 [Neoarius graeffei]|uniref:histamine N-methyltransferase-like isoform X2 n=1 Tax=Neoarius graeffei TaxID=443677 RepID=UPI00298C1324|nr:histamine N-methyltransferase-like isoform X2 [Neoarius graeffei]
MALFNMIRQWLNNSGWDNALVQGDVTREGRADGILKASHITSTRYAHQRKMALQIRSLVEDCSRYLKAFELYLERSSDHQSVRGFIQSTLPDILTTYSVGAGKSTLNIMGVGCGSGEIDMEILTQLHAKYSGARVEYEVVEPNRDMLDKYKGLALKTPGLDHTTFRFHMMTASEFESDWKQRNPDRKMDFIHMIQMLYYVKDPEMTVSFFRSLLRKDGKLLIILVSGDSGWSGLWRHYHDRVHSSHVTAADIKSFLDAKEIPYKSYSFVSTFDITECFTTRDEKEELMLDFLTEIPEFSKSTSPELKARVLEILKRPECSQEVNGRIMFNNNMEALVIDQ